MVTSRYSKLLPALYALIAIGSSACVMVTPSHAQVVAVAVEASVTVEGRVAYVFQADQEYLVQILVQKSELADLASAAMASYPAPGEYVYVHVNAGRGSAGRFGRDNSGSLPAAQTYIRASLSKDKSAQWTAAGTDWFQTVSDQPAINPSPANRSAVTLGLVTQPVSLGRETALKVVSVTPNSPAAAAGIEPGDVLVRANRESLESEGQLEDLFRRSPRGITLTIRDVRSGRDVDVDVEPASASPRVDQRGAMQPLGVTAKLAFFSGQPALEITEVKANSPAARAGLEPGLLIVEANGTAVGSQEELHAAERSSGGRLELRVVNRKEAEGRREKVVTVAL